MKKYFILFCFLFFIISAEAQKTEIKYYPSGYKAGDVALIYSYGEYNGGISSKVFVVEVPANNYYYISSLVNMRRGQAFGVNVDGAYVNGVSANTDGWQYRTDNSAPVKLTAGKHTIKFIGTDASVPMTDELSLTLTPVAGKTDIPQAVSIFLNKMEVLKQQSVLISPSGSDEMNFVNKVLPNPEGIYGHAIDTAFGYSHFSWIYLNPGSHVFKTTGSTISRALTIFNPSNFTESWSNVNGGINGESYLNISVSAAAYFAVTLRPVTNGQTGTANITYNGDPLVNNAVIGGKTYGMSSLKGGPMNFFTCRLTAGDTRMIASRSFSSSARGYNDDYSGGGGAWNWGLASRIKKDFSGSDSVRYAFVCAYSPASTGVCDIYLGTQNASLPAAEPANFPNLFSDDAIRTANNNGNYNCIAWTGGITSNWIWPPSSLSTYSCNGAPVLQCFDNFYSNNPVRYPGAWNYTRTGATVNNSIVDLWKTAAAYTHASIKKPGNNHPHGYDWESKPGGLDRTLHPRNALSNPNWYGSVTNYYIATGTYARNAGAEYAIASDADAVKAGLAIFDKATLTKEADDKLKNFLNKINKSLSASFEVLYKAWDDTKAAQATLSDPAAYCKNKEYRALEKFALANQRAAMLLTFDKFIQGDHIVGELMLTLTMDKYAKFLDEVKTERLANLYTKDGLYRIHGDHDNGVLYIEKILKSLETDEVIITPVEDIIVSVSPNPVKDILTVQVMTVKNSRISVKITSSQTLVSRVVQQEKEFSAGTNRFTASVQGIAGNSGDILAVQVTVNGILKTVKVLVAK